MPIKKTPTSIADDPIWEAQIHDVGETKVKLTRKWLPPKRKGPAPKKKPRPARRLKADGTPAKWLWNNQYSTKDAKPLPKETKAQKEERDMKMRNLQNEYNYLVCEWYAKALACRARYKGVPLERLIYAAFLALPQCRVTTQREMAAFFGKNEASLIYWRMNQKVLQARTEIMQNAVMEHTPDILNSLVKHAQRTNLLTGLGDAQMIKLFLQYVEKWQEKAELDVTSWGAQIVWWLQPSQFINKDNIPLDESSEDSSHEESTQEDQEPTEYEK